jgi:diguanylate cyclase (GGDEF)-like protein
VRENSQYLALMPSTRTDLATFPNSPYAAELQRGGGSRAFSPAIEAEYVRTHLRDNRALIRAAAALAALTTAARVVDRLVLDDVEPSSLIFMSIVLAMSALLAGVAFSGAFERSYLRVAHFVVPIRNLIAAVGIVQTAAQGELEVLMVVPLLVLGPFYFTGLRFRAASWTVVITAVALVAAAAVFGLATPIALRALAFLTMIAAACAIAARNVEQSSRKSFLESHLIEELAHHDTLTGLKNRRVFDEQLDRLWDRGTEEHRDLAILMVDIDHFKAYNDWAGHQAGDQTLRRVAQALQGFVTRPLDVLARYGGEEFALVAYDIDSSEAEMLAEQMRVAVRALEIKHEGTTAAGGSVTISIGVAAVQPSADRRSRGALQLADQALYEAKVTGRNRVEVLGDVAHRLLVTGVFAKYALARRH